MRRVAYADSPYRGCCARYKHFHPDGRCWDDEETHRLLVERLNRDFQDGWALCLKSDTAELAKFIGWAGPGVRLSPWVKPFHVFKPNVNPSYGWEGVLWKQSRKRARMEPTVKDFHIENITLRKGLVGAKPPGFNRWILQLLAVQPEDVVVDLFPGTGSMRNAVVELAGVGYETPPMVVGNLEKPAGGP